MPATAAAGDICVHYSIAQNYARSADASFAALENFACQLGAQLRQLCGHGSLSLLLVSGSQRRQLDTVAALQRLAASPRFQSLEPPLPLAVAFNPYFPDEPRLLEEQRRLRRKLEAGRGLVTAVYLQAGAGAVRGGAGRGGFKVGPGCAHPTDAPQLPCLRMSPFILFLFCCTSRFRALSSVRVQAGSDADRLDQGLQFLQQVLDEQAAPAQEAVQRSASGQVETAGRQQALPLQPPAQQRDQEAPPAKRARRQLVEQQADGGAGRSAAEMEPSSDAATATQPAVFGSVLLPSKRLLAQMRFRPWAGVFLRWASRSALWAGVPARAEQQQQLSMAPPGRLHPHRQAPCLPSWPLAPAPPLPAATLT